MINEGSWGRACILTLDCTGASGRTLVSDGFSAALRLPLLLGRSRHANCMPQQWLAMWNYDRGNKTSSTQQACEGVRPDITRVGWWCCALLIQVLAGKRLIANFPEVSTAHRCVRRTSDRPSDCWCRPVQGYFQPSFITSFQHQLQNGGEKIDGWRGLVNMRDRNDTRGVPFGVVVVARVTAQKMKRQAVGFSGSTLIPIKLILTCKHFCAYSN